VQRRWLLWIPVVLLVGGIAGYWGYQVWLEQSQDGPIQFAARRYGVEPALVKAVVWRESRFHPDLRGHAQELGLMQIRDAAALEWVEAERIGTFNHETCLDPVTNTLAGTFYLRKLLRRYSRTDNPIPYALADYNAGRANVLRWTGGSALTNSGAFVAQIGFPGTREYVRSILRRYEKYQRQFPPQGATNSSTGTQKPGL
jgi:soluble lytic murein transglycosylase